MNGKEIQLVTAANVRVIFKANYCGNYVTEVKIAFTLVHFPSHMECISVCDILIKTLSRSSCIYYPL